jgi:hypothetical protein
VTRKRRSVLALASGVVAGILSVLSWFGARSVVAVSPIQPGEPSTTSVIYSAPMLTLMLLLATIAGVLAVLGVAGLVSGDRAGSAIATPATGPASASDPSAGRRLRP